MRTRAPSDELIGHSSFKKSKGKAAPLDFDKVIESILVAVQFRDDLW